MALLVPMDSVSNSTGQISLVNAFRTGRPWIGTLGHWDSHERPIDGRSVSRGRLEPRFGLPKSAISKRSGKR